MAKAKQTKKKNAPTQGGPACWNAPPDPTVFPMSEMELFRLERIMVGILGIKEMAEQISDDTGIGACIGNALALPYDALEDLHLLLKTRHEGGAR